MHLALAHLAAQEACHDVLTNLSPRALAPRAPLAALQQAAVDKVARVGFVAGTVVKEKVLAFERLLFRATRGNMLLKQQDVGLIKDPESGESLSKVVFCVFFAGERAQNKIHKVRGAWGDCDDGVWAVRRCWRCVCLGWRGKRVPFGSRSRGAARAACAWGGGTAGRCGERRAGSQGCYLGLPGPGRIHGIGCGSAGGADGSTTLGVRCWRVRAHERLRVRCWRARVAHARRFARCLAPTSTPSPRTLRASGRWPPRWRGG